MKTTIICDKRDETGRALDARILAHMEGPRDDASFDRLALDVFAYQYERNAPYRRYCAQIGCDPSRAASWRDIPAVPSGSFADARLACFPPERAAVTFVSSGTSSAGARASHHELDAPDLYDGALCAQYQAFVLPDLAALPHIFLAPPFAEAPESSLSYMLTALDRRFGAPGGGFFVNRGELDFDAVSDALSREGPFAIFGTAFAFVHFSDRCRAQGKCFALRPGSRVIETGGFKGKSREVARDELYAWFEALLGVSPEMCVSEYGMCELGSQWYDVNIADSWNGRTPRRHVKSGPHWARTLIVDPVSARSVTPGETGLLQIFDLCNRGSVAAILTGDLARERNGGIEILGRHPGAPPKGCSIAADAMLDGAGA